MQVTELETNGLKKKFKVVVEASRIETQTEAELQAAGERVKIPGFRPGFIPMKVLKQRYGKSVQADVLNQVINQSTSEALRQKNIRPATTPQINIENYQDGGDLTFTIALDVFPDVPEVSFDHITLERSVFDIEDKNIDEALGRIAERAPDLERAEAGTQADIGNVVSIDFKGMIDGVAFDGGAASDYRLDLGSGQFIPGFEEQLVGMKEGENRLIQVKFPDNYSSSNLAGKNSEFAVQVKEIFAKKTPEINEEFAKARGFVDVRALREAVRNQLLKEYEQIVRRHLKKQLFDTLDDAHDFELPQSMVDLEFNSIWERLKQAQTEGDPSVAGRSEDDLKAEYQHIAKRRVKLGILLAEVGNRNNVQVSREELGRAVMQQASMFPGQEKQVMEFYRSHPERMEDMRGPILEEKAVDFILTKVKFNDTKIELDDLNDEEDDSDTQAKKPAKSAKSKDSKPESKDSAEEKQPRQKAASKKKTAS